MRHSFRQITLTSSAIAAALLYPAIASAQTAPATQQPASVPTVVVEGEAPAVPAYRFGTAIDSGTSILSEEAVRTNAPGSGDAIDLLRRLAGTQFAIERDTRVTEESLRDLRPEMISISGGRPTDNMFTLDGIGTNTLFELTTPGTRSTLPAHFEDVAGVSAQSIFIDTNLIGGITVRDSNISAEYGKFTGGVVEIVTRDPGRRYSVQGSVGYSGSELTSWKTAPGFTGTLPEEPDYRKLRWSLSADLPITETISVLAAYNRSEAESTYTRSATYGGGKYGSLTFSENYLLKTLVELPNEMRLTAQVTHAPYRSDYEGGSGINNLIVTHSGGTTGKISLEGVRGVADWRLELNHAWSDMDRDAPRYNFSRPTGGIVNWCASSTCTEGGFGDINQSQRDTSFLGRWTQPFGGGDLNLGFDYNRTEAQKERPEEGRAYQRGAYDTRTVCASPTDIACVAGDHASLRYISYGVFDFNVGIDAFSAFGEYTREINGVTFRAGLRYDYESFLGNHTLSPRLSVSGELPWFGITATGGLNRYYGRSFLSYAVRQARPGNLTYERTGVLTGGQLVFSENWNLTAIGTPANYADADLDTPYSDEATLALTGPAPFVGGEWRLKGVIRESRDLIVSNPGQVTTYDDVNRARTYTIYSPSNEGESSYKGGSFEYIRTFGRHSLTFSTAFSETKSNANREYDIDDFEDIGSTQVVYNGQLVSLIDIAQQNDRLDFASPFVGNLSWSSRWVDDRLSLSGGLRYRGSFERVEDTGVNQRINNVNYDVYDVVGYKPSVDVDLNASFDVIRDNGRQATLEARVANLFDTVPNKSVSFSTNPYQIGRVVWLGMRFRY
ncbi:hypothetical protein [Brevundimonas kwangchunensis]